MTDEHVAVDEHARMIEIDFAQVQKLDKHAEAANETTACAVVRLARMNERARIVERARTDTHVLCPQADAHYHIARLLSSARLPSSANARRGPTSRHSKRAPARWLSRGDAERFVRRFLLLRLLPQPRSHRKLVGRTGKFFLMCRH